MGEVKLAQRSLLTVLDACECQQLFSDYVPNNYCNDKQFGCSAVFLPAQFYSFLGIPLDVQTKCRKHTII